MEDGRTQPTSERRDTFVHTAAVFGASLAVNGANFAFHFGAVRLLGLSAYSALAALLGVVLICSAPANVLQAIVTAVVAEAASTRAESAVIARRITKGALAVSVAIIVLGAAVSKPLASYLSLNDSLPVILAFVSIGIAFSLAALRGILQGEQRFGTFALSLICEAFGNFVFGLGFIVWFGGVRSAILGNVCAVLSAFTASVIWTWRKVTAIPLTVDVRRLLAKFVGTSIAFGGIAAMSWFDVILVRHLMLASDAGLYAALSIVGKTILFSVSSLPLVLLAKASRLSGQKRATRPLFIGMFATGMTIILVELSTINLFPAAILRALAGPAATAAAPYILLYAVGMCSLAMTTIVANYGIGTHRFGFVVPLILVEAGEIAGISLRHSNLFDVVSIVAIGHSTALVLAALAVVAGPRIPRAFHLFGQDKRLGAA
ncbi:MAG: hypothetical protein JOZ38_03370 [Candidatus Eremiobacteraeota bacterium]|nr:hypothetical protein [Candidatus Eremiobacteraeota bacterium]